MLRVQTYTDIDLVPTVADDFLEQDAAASNIPVGILRRLRAKPEQFRNYRIFIMEDEAGIQGYAHYMPPYPLVFGRGNIAAAQLLGRVLREENASFDSIHGPSDLVQAFASSWPELFQKVKQREKHGLYKLERVIFPKPSGAVFGPATEKDLSTLVTWHQAFGREAGDMLVSEQEIAMMQMDRIKAGDLLVLREGSQLVSMATISRTMGLGRVLSFIYTPPDLRGRGYASELTALASAHILKSGFQFCCLFTQMHNPTSNKIYQNVGYEWLQNFDLVRFAGTE